MTSSADDAETGVGEPGLVSVDGVITAVIRGVIPSGELPAFFDSSFTQLAETLSTQKLTVAGPAFGLYNGPPGETVDLEVGYVTDTSVQPVGDVVASSLPGGRVGRLVHHGAFDGLGSSWERLRTWIREQGLTPGWVMWESYLTEPSPEMDPRDLRVELNWPAAD